MHNLAIDLAEQGHTITGSDDNIYDPAKSQLQQRGLLPESFGWFPEKITTDLDAVILGMHAKADNPELNRALELDIPIYSFPEFVYERTKAQKRVVIAGSHGKTTITSMVMEALRATGQPFNYVVGAQLPGYNLMTRLADDAEIAVIEGDEYLTSTLDPQPKFLHYKPEILLLSGIAWDHMNAFPTYPDYLKAFQNLLASLEQNTDVVYCADDPELSRLVEPFKEKVILHPYHTADHEVKDGKFWLRPNGTSIPLHIFGQHNMQNLAGAWQVSRLLGIPDPSFLKAIAAFKGAAKRLQLLSESSSVSVYRDFAHAPSKVKASVQAAKQLFPNRPLVACVELHTYSSLNPAFLPEYKSTLDRADQAMVFIHPDALKAKGQAIEAADIIQAFDRPDLQVFFDKLELEKTLKEIDLPSYTLLLMSSGHFGGLDLEQLATFATAHQKSPPDEA